MGVDHGLGGRDCKKSKDRRLKRSKKNKVIATKALRGGFKELLLKKKDAYPNIFTPSQQGREKR